MTKLTALFLVCLITTVLTSEPVPFTINSKKLSHVLDDHFISITINPTDLLQGKVYGLQMNSTMAILKGLAPAYVRIGSADTAKYTFKSNRYPSDVVKPDDEYTVTETHWMVFNEVVQQAGLDVIVCLNAAHRTEGTKKWDTRNSLELISFSDSQGYNLTWQLGYEIQGGDNLSGVQFGKDLNRLRTILNAFPRYQQAKLIGPDIRVIHKKEDIDFWNDVLIEAGPTLDAVTWHPRWPQPSKMKVSDNSELGYEFPVDYLEWDRMQLNKILQKSIFKNPVWIGETKRESTGTFAEGLLWARRLVLAAKSGIEVVMKQPNLMDITHPKPEYWIALLHKRLLGKSVLETRSQGNNTALTVISHCTNPFYWSDKPEKLQDGAVTVYGVNMGGLEQKIQIKGTWSGKSQLLFQYVLTSGSDPDSVFSQMTYLNGEPLMMTDDGLLPDIIPKVKKLEKGLTMKLPPYSVGFWVVPEARVKLCQLQPQNIPTINIETLTPSNVLKSPPNLENIRDINQFMVEKLKNPESESEEVAPLKIEIASEESSEKDLSKENNLPRVARKIRQINTMDDINQQIKTIMKEAQEFIASGVDNLQLKPKIPKGSPTMEKTLQGLAEDISHAIKSTNQQKEFNKFLEDSGLKQDFGGLIMNDQRFNAPGMKNFQPFLHGQNSEGHFDEFEVKERLRRSITESEEASHESIEDEDDTLPLNSFHKKISLAVKSEEVKNLKPDLIIPHQPDLKGLEERYKFIVQSKIQDGKRKIDDIKRKIKQEEIDVNPKIKPSDAVNELQEEIIKKEIELLEKTEETVADILKSQKKRQETFEDIIFDELNDVKEERIRELEEMQKRKENTIVKRQTQTPLSKPLIKTVEYIEKNLNLEPESVKKIKRSLEERMGEILKSYDTRKSMEIKKRMSPKEERKISSRRPVKEYERKPEYLETFTKSERREHVEESRSLTKERPKEKNVVKKISTAQHHTKPLKKHEESSRTKKSEEQKKSYKDENDSFELFNEKKLEEPVKKPDRRRAVEIPEEKKPKKIQSKVVFKEDKSIEEKEPQKEKKKIEKEVEEEKTEKEEPKQESAEVSPLKNDKQRREKMLKQISLLVDKMNSRENGEFESIRKADDDISVEFESDRRPRGIRRRPRKAEMTEEVSEKKELSEISEVPEAPVMPEPTTPPTKLSKLRKLRLRAGRKQKELKKTEPEEDPNTQQKKRHLDRSLLELNKKKLLKPKLRKLNPKFHIHGNELLINEKPELVQIPIQDEMPKEQSTTVKEPETIVKESVLEETVKEPETIVQQTVPEEAIKQEEKPLEPVLTPNEELKKDLEEIVEEKVFLGQGLENSKEKFEKSGKENFQTQSSSQDEANLETTESTTEGYIIVDPTEESDEADTTEKALKSAGEKSSTEEKPENSEKVSKNQNENTSKSPENDVTVTENYETLMEKKTSAEEFDSESSSTSVEYSESKEEEEEEEVIPPTVGNISQRKRRATFLPQHHEEEDEDYSSEERIEKFKQMIYRTSPSKKGTKNEVRTTSSMGMGADEFLRMAGSTMRVMFDDVIPEAYGQTKDKIQNMGITEYIKEFGKIVQQMKNLDQIFLNIGEAAVKGYIRGNKAEKGPYIQVISRKKRGAKHEDSLPINSETSSELGLTQSGVDQTNSDADLPVVKTGETEDTTDGSFGYATTSTGEAFVTAGQLGDREDPWDIGAIRRESGKSVHGHDKTLSMEETKTTDTFQSQKLETEKTLPTVEDPSEQLTDSEKKNSDTNELPKSSNKVQIRKKTESPDFQKILQDNGVAKKISALVPEDLQKKIFSPWIKTTKDFIKQAITTLQRQKELSEILAKDLVNREMTKKAIGKREVGDEKPQLPVFHMVPPSSNKKRETQTKHSDENLIRHLRGLQPGVYVVPTEEMTNIRSEQITNEAKQNSGVPNVVTLNIYYDKKNADEDNKDETTVPVDTKTSQDSVTYYQNKVWNTAAGQYNQNHQYLAVPEVKVATPVVAPLQVNPAFQTQAVFSAEPRVAELPNSRLVQYPTPAFHYPPVQKMYPAVVPIPPVYNPVYYLPQESRYASHPPGTKRQWREFKARSAAVPYNSGWNIQYDVPATMRNSAKSIFPTSYNKNYKLMVQDKKRSVGDHKIEPTWSESALPFWKFFSTSEKQVGPDSAEKGEPASVETESAEDVFVENRKRAKAAGEKKTKVTPVEKATEEKVPEEEEEEEETEEPIEVEEKSRRRRSINSLPADAKRHHLHKRSHPYTIEFKDHDVLPEWFGTYQEIENSLDSFPPHVRRSHIISTPWSEEDDELLSILEADDELSLIDLDTDDYYFNDNAIHQIHRYPRSTDQFDSNMIKSNMIYKMPMDGDHLKPKGLGMLGVKKLTDEDSSLELITKLKPVEMKTPTTTTTTTTTTATSEEQKKPEDLIAKQVEETGKSEQTTTVPLPRNPNDDALYYFFKYAYDSFVKVMKSMTQLF